MPVDKAKQVRATLSSLEKMSTKRDRANLAKFGINATRAFGVSMANIQVVAKRLGPSHELADALWDTGWYEARMLASLIDEPDRVTSAQMDRWCRDFDNWGICDTVCFHLFDRPHARGPSRCGAEAREFTRRAGFALLARPRRADKGRRTRSS
jgi:3-methyladenine DNA glycosylase AlkD